MTRYKYTRVHQWGGDDGYCWAVFLKGRDKPVVCGLTKREVPLYRERIERQEITRRGGQEVEDAT